LISTATDSPLDSGRRGRALACAVLALTFFGIAPVMLRELAEYRNGYLDVWTVNASRYSISALFWLPFVVMLSCRRPAGMAPVAAADGGPAPRRASVWLCALAPWSVNIVAQVAWAAAPYFLTAPVIGFSSRLSFLFTIVFGFLFIREERALLRNAYFWAGALACLLGVGAMFGRDIARMDRMSVIGFGLMLTSGCGYGAYAVCVRRFMSGFSTRLSYGVMSLYTAASLLVLMLALGNYGALADAGARNWVLMGGSSLLGLAFGHVLYYKAIHGLGAVIASGMLMAMPFVTLAVAWLFLGEGMTPLQFLGGAGVVVGGGLLVKAQSVRALTGLAAEEG